MSSVGAFSYIALLLIAPVCLVAFSIMRPPMACASLILGATMLLPVRVSFDLAGMPPLGREELTCIFILVVGMFRCRGRLISAAPGRGLEILVFALMAGAIATAATNGDPLAYGPVRLQSVSIREGFSEAIRDLLRYALPFFIGRAFFRSPRDLRDLFWVMTVAGLLYTLLILLELRLSPQLHRWTYGFHQHGMAGTIRYGGYRPMVYMANGLALTLFMATTCIMSAALTKAMRSIGRSGAILALPGAVLTPYLLVILVACKSLAAIGYGVFGTALVTLLKPRALMRIALVMSLLVTIYPAMRATDSFPIDGLLRIARSIDEKRSQSLEYRFRNEDRLLEKARERPAFGWGGFRRMRAFNERGVDTSVTDGYWIIMLGERGMLGMACTFGLLVIPVLLAYRRFSSIGMPAERTLIAALSLIVAIHTLDLLPNGLFSYLPVFFSGALMGALEGIRQGSRRRAPPIPRSKNLGLDGLLSPRSVSWPSSDQHPTLLFIACDTDHRKGESRSRRVLRFRNAT